MVGGYSFDLNARVFLQTDLFRFLSFCYLVIAAAKQRKQQQQHNYHQNKKANYRYHQKKVNTFYRITKGKEKL